MQVKENLAQGIPPISIPLIENNNNKNLNQYNGNILRKRCNIPPIPLSHRNPLKNIIVDSEKIISCTERKLSKDRSIDQKQYNKYLWQKRWSKGNISDYEANKLNLLLRYKRPSNDNSLSELRNKSISKLNHDSIINDKRNILENSIRNNQKNNLSGLGMPKEEPILNSIQLNEGDTNHSRSIRKDSIDGVDSTKVITYNNAAFWKRIALQDELNQQLIRRKSETNLNSSKNSNRRQGSPLKLVNPLNTREYGPTIGTYENNQINLLHKRTPSVIFFNGKRRSMDKSNESHKSIDTKIIHDKQHVEAGRQNSFRLMKKKDHIIQNKQSHESINKVKKKQDEYPKYIQMNNNLMIKVFPEVLGFPEDFDAKITELRSQIYELKIATSQKGQTSVNVDQKQINIYHLKKKISSFKFLAQFSKNYI